MFTSGHILGDINRKNLLFHEIEQLARNRKNGRTLGNGGGERLGELGKASWGGSRPRGGGRAC